MTALDVELLPWQQDVYADTSRFKVVAAGRRTGKSRLAAWLLIINGLQADKGHVFYVAPTQGQARDILWQTIMELGHPVIAGSHINNLQIYCYKFVLALSRIFAIDTYITPNPLVSLGSYFQN